MHKKFIITISETLVAKIVNGSGRIGFGSGYIIFLLFLTRSESDLIKFGSKNLNLTRSGHRSTQPDPCKIIKYLLIIFI
jgi:hypothetical protein